jgi:hypothetical protein
LAEGQLLDAEVSDILAAGETQQPLVRARVDEDPACEEEGRGASVKSIKDTPIGDSSNNSGRNNSGSSNY